MTTENHELRNLRQENAALEESLSWAFGTIMILARHIKEWDELLINEAGVDTIVRVSNRMERTLEKELPPEFTRESPPLLEELVAQAKKRRVTREKKPKEGR